MVANYNASKVGAIAKYLPYASGVKVFSSVALTTALVANDTVTFMSLKADASAASPYGPTIVGMLFAPDDLDSNGAPAILFDIGDAGSATRYYSSVNTAQAGGVAIPNVASGIGYQPFASSFGTYTTVSDQTYTILATCHTAAATWQNGTVRLVVEYNYDA